MMRLMPSLEQSIVLKFEYILKIVYLIDLILSLCNPLVTINSEKTNYNTKNVYLSLTMTARGRIRKLKPYLVHYLLVIASLLRITYEAMRSTKHVTVMPEDTGDKSTEQRLV